MAVKPCLSLAPLRAIICSNRKRMERTTRIRTVRIAEIAAGDLLRMFAPGIWKKFEYGKYILTPGETSSPTHLSSGIGICFINSNDTQKNLHDLWIIYFPCILLKIGNHLFFCPSFAVGPI